MKSGPTTHEVPSAPEAVDGVLERLLGSAPGGQDSVVHVCSSWEDETGALRAIRVGPGAPQSRFDDFLLRATRAQADAIVTSGSIVRSESGLQHALGTGALGACLADYRTRLLGKARPPLSVVLTHSGELPTRHPLWDDWTSVRVWTAPGRVASLRRQLPSHVAVVPATGEGVPGALEALAAEGFGRISLELGPSAMRPLYQRGVVDSLWACRFLGPELCARARGEAWPFTPDDLERWRVAEGACVVEPSGRWRFARHLVR